MAFRLQTEKPGEQEGAGQVGGIGDQKHLAPEVGLEEEEVLVGVLASGLAEEGFFRHALGLEVAAAHLPLAEAVPRAPTPGHGDAGGQALAVEDEGGLEAPF